MNDKNPLEHQHEQPNEKKHFNKKKLIHYVVMTISAIVFFYSAFMLFKIYMEYKEGNDIYESIANTVLIPDETASADTEAGEDTPTPFVYNHEALLNINPEGVGYLYVPSINLRLPIVQSTDNDYYLNHTFNRTYNGAGTLFLDYRITGGLSNSHVLIYGHNMRNGSMFAGLQKYLTPSFYKTEGNDVFYIYTEDKLLEYKIFSAYVSAPISNTYTLNFSSLPALREYAQSMKELSSYNMGVDISTSEQIVTFSTCTNDGENRVIVQGTLINKSVLEQ